MNNEDLNLDLLTLSGSYRANEQSGKNNLLVETWLVYFIFPKAGQLG